MNRPRLKLIASIIALMILTAWPPPHAAVNPDAAAPKTNDPVKEVTFTRVVLTPEAERRLAIRTAPIQTNQIQRVRGYGGEIIFALRQNQKPNAPEDAPPTKPGAFTTLFDLDPPDDTDEARLLIDLQLKADEKVALAKVALEAAQITLGRAEKLLSGKVGSQRAVDDARALMQAGRESLSHAQRQRNFLGPALLGAINLQDLWIKVPVYAGDLPRLDVSAPAQINNLSRVPGLEPLTILPVEGPPTADGKAFTVDLYYQLPDNKRGFRPEQRVAVDIAMLESIPLKAIPFSAVLRDIHGGTWVYENTEPQTFKRRRVLLRHVINGQAILEKGPPLGAIIVIEGAAELFSTELGFGK